MTAQIDPPFVLAALDDDASCADVLTYARDQARQRGLPLRVVHVWTRHDDPPAASDERQVRAAGHLQEPDA